MVVSLHHRYTSAEAVCDLKCTYVDLEVNIIIVLWNRAYNDATAMVSN